MSKVILVIVVTDLSVPEIRQKCATHCAPETNLHAKNPYATSFLKIVVANLQHIMTILQQLCARGFRFC